MKIHVSDLIFACCIGSCVMIICYFSSRIIMLYFRFLFNHLFPVTSHIQLWSHIRRKHNVTGSTWHVIFMYSYVKQSPCEFSRVRYILGFCQDCSYVMLGAIVLKRNSAFVYILSRCVNSGHHQLREEHWSNANYVSQTRSMFFERLLVTRKLFMAFDPWFSIIMIILYYLYNLQTKDW